MSTVEVKKHPSVFEVRMLVLNIFLSILGVIIGLELITRVGVSPDTSIIGALLTILVALIPLKALRVFRDPHRLNISQTTISAATFSAANAILIPVGVTWALGRPDLLIPMWFGAVAAAIIDLLTIYYIFDSKLYPARNPWPPGIAAAEVIRAAIERGKRALILLYGMIAGGVMGGFGIPADVLGISWISNIWALTMFGVGLIIRGYPQLIGGIDLYKLYAPHGIMIGAGVVSLIQMALLLRKTPRSASESSYEYTRTEREALQALVRLFIVYTVIALILAVIGGLYTNMSAGMFVWWIIYAAIAALTSALIVGISAMQAGWFPAFAVTLIYLVLGMLMGFPAPALGLLTGYTAATGPMFADGGYDFKAGWILRGYGSDRKFEMEGRKQQLYAKIIAITIGATMVLLLARIYFTHNLIPPVDRVYAVTINAGINPEVSRYLLLWSIPGAILQAIGGSERQLGILFATGLLIYNPIAGIVALIGVASRAIILRMYGERGQNVLYILGAGFIGGSAVASFTTLMVRAGFKKS